MTLEQALERIAELEKQLDKAQLTINTLLISASKKQ
jgi:hypothetical protein